jgi:GTP-binding protein
MFIDEVSLTFKAGKGGDGSVSWRREKYIPNGGPFGGDGGKGGDIVLVATSNENTLSGFRHVKTVRAEDGEKGATKEMHGAGGQDRIVEVPVGTIVSSTETGEVLFDLSTDGDKAVLCEGGRGGFGNAHFATSTRQAPNFAELGDRGEEARVKMELKLVADVGIIGLPNAGKSTFISAVTAVRPKIADYPFTTLIPNLGVMEHKGKSLVLEDVPGLIPGASEGKGLGIRFLKHIERTEMLLHLLDASRLEQAWQDYRDIRAELEAFSPEVAAKDEWVVLTKIDLVSDEDLTELLKQAKKELPGKRVFAISAGAMLRVEILKDELIQKAEGRRKQPATEDGESEPTTRTYDLKSRKDSDDHPKIERTDRQTFTVSGERLNQIVRMTEMSNPEAVARIYDILEKLGVLRKILAAIERDSGEKIRDSFFEGNADEDLKAKIVIEGRVFPLEKTLFSKRIDN